MPSTVRSSASTHAHVTEPGSARDRGELGVIRSQVPSVAPREAVSPRGTAAFPYFRVFDKSFSIHYIATFLFFAAFATVV